MKQHAPATERNREPIRRVLAEHLPARGLVLEIASGSGEHAVYMAAALPELRWQPSDAAPAALASIEAWRFDAGLTNVLPPVALDVTAPAWPVAAADAIVCINMVHIAPWEAALTLFAGALAALPSAEVLQYSADGVAQIVRGDLGRVEVAHQDALVGGDGSLREALPPVLKAFRLENEDLRLRKVNVDEVGGRHYRYDQVFQGLPVVGGELVVHVDRKGAITGINGTARGDIAPMLGAQAVARGAATVSIESDERWAGMTGRTIREGRAVYLQTQAGTLHKAYEQIVEGQRDQDPVIDKVYVDVETGAVLEVHPQIHHVRKRMTHSVVGTSLPGIPMHNEFVCVSLSCDDDVFAAHKNAGHVYDLYNQLWNRDGIDGVGGTLISSVHYSTNYCNAFWNGNQMIYGDGNASQGCLPLARSIDVAAHEMTHGVTSKESNLNYSGEPGGLNESISDIFAAGVKSWAEGGTTLPYADDVFLIGEDVLSPFLRSMCDPAADGVSKDVWYSGIGGIDTHYSSGPNNLVFCLLVKGGVHPRGKTTYPVTAIGMEKALRLMYMVNTDFATTTTNYASWRNLAVMAAELLNFTQVERDAVACAYAAIKVGAAPVSCGGTPPPDLWYCASVTGIADAVGNWKYYSFVVPAGQSMVRFRAVGGASNMDLFGRYGAQPTAAAYQCHSSLSSNVATCEISSPQAGTYYIGLRALSAYSGVTLTPVYWSGPFEVACAVKPPSGPASVI